MAIVVPGTQHLEPFVDAAVTTLRGELNGRIDGVNSVATDFEIDRVPETDEAWAVGGTAGPPVVFPTIEVAVPDWSLRDFDYQQLHSTFWMSLVVRIWAADAHSPERLYRRLLRYARCTLSVLLEPDAFGVHTVIDRQRGVQGRYRFNPDRNEKEEVTGAVVLVFNLDEVEAAP